MRYLDSTFLQTSLLCFAALFLSSAELSAQWYNPATRFFAPSNRWVNPMDQWYTPMDWYGVPDYYDYDYDEEFYDYANGPDVGYYGYPGYRYPFAYGYPYQGVPYRNFNYGYGYNDDSDRYQQRRDQVDVPANQDRPRRAPRRQPRQRVYGNFYTSEWGEDLGSFEDWYDTD